MIKIINISLTETTPGYIYFDPGWKFVAKRRDNSDYEWEAWRHFLSESLWIFAVHAIVMEVIRSLKIKVKPENVWRAS